MVTLVENYRNAKVGIWWWTGNEILARDCYYEDGENDGQYIQYSNTENHLTLWNNIRKEYNDKNLMDKGYKYLERGRVIYNIRSRVFEIICSEEVVYDDKFRKACVNYFNLNGCRHDFIALNHYHKVQTDNPVLLRYEYDEF